MKSIDSVPSRRNVDGITVEITRKKIKTLRITVARGDGAVRVSAPVSLGYTDISAFVKEKSDWIRKQRERLAKIQSLQTENFSDGGSVCLWGCRLALFVRTGHGFSVSVAENKANVTVPASASEENIRAFWEEFCRKELRARVAQRLPIWETVTGLVCRDWCIRKMVSRWGTCNTRTKKLCFSLNLAKKPPACLDYVIIHELGHISVPNHGADFKNYMNKFCPDWKALKKLLNG